MIHAPEPTRAEATDVANAVIDGTSAVMLSAETSVGHYPVEAVRAMSQLPRRPRSIPVIHGRAHAGVRDTPAASVMHAAVELAEELDAAALLVPTSGGGSPRACAKYRRRQPIIAFPHTDDVANQLTLEWGVYPRRMDVSGSVDDLIERSLLTAKEFGGLAQRYAGGDHCRAADRHYRRDEPDPASRDIPRPRARSADRVVGYLARKRMAWRTVALCFVRTRSRRGPHRSAPGGCKGGTLVGAEGDLPPAGGCRASARGIARCWLRRRPRARWGRHDARRAPGGRAARCPGPGGQPRPAWLPDRGRRRAPRRRATLFR